MYRTCMKAMHSKNPTVSQKKSISTSTYLLGYLVHQIIHQEHPAKWRQGYSVFENELAELADQFQATELHTSN